MGQKKTTIQTGTWSPTWGYSLEASASMAQYPTNQNRNTGSIYNYPTVYVKKPKNSIVSGSNFAQFQSYMTGGSKAFGISPTSASLKTETYSSGGISYVANPNSLSTQMINAGSSSKDVSEVIGLIDVRLNPELYSKYIMNAALTAGSSSKEATELAYPSGSRNRNGRR